ncbi:MAG: hypothetical protein V7L05_32940 [Nostoc sp.]|uniref:hypothetical protein n=1 Tax=Nostoc sp. TaxID=1180 RepID=UPI002FFA3851
MTQTAAITEAITTLQDAENRFGFVRVEDEQFFPEWYEGLSEITEPEKASVDVVRRRYLYHRAAGDLLEGTVILLLVSPILALSGFYDPPFRIENPKTQLASLCVPESAAFSYQFCMKMR